MKKMLIICLPVISAVNLIAWSVVGPGFIPSFHSSTDIDRRAEKTAIPTAQYQLAGFWKAGSCQDDFGLAISPAGDNQYSVSFCGPGGCFRPGSYLPNTSIINDDLYRVINNDTIEVSGSDGFLRYTRCPQR